MAKGYRPVVRDQQFLLPPDMREWLPASDPVWLLIDLVEGMDTSAFHGERRIGGAGRAGYDPDMLLTLVVWGWLQGVRSSRRIERSCGRDVGFRVICAGDAPDHVTIARFVQGFADAVESLMVEVLLVCRRLGLAQLGVVALDGTKMASSASREANRSEEGLRRAQAGEQEAEAERAAKRAAREAAAEHAAQDASDDARFGENHHGDEMPEDAVPQDPIPEDTVPQDPMPEDAAAEDAAEDAGSGSRRGPGGLSRKDRIARAVAQVAAEKQRAVAAEAAKVEARRVLEESRGGRPVGGRPVAGTELVRAEQAVAQAREYAAVWAGKRGVPVEQHWRVRKASARVDRVRVMLARRQAKEAVAGARARGPVANLTDPDSRLQPLRGGGWLQGYNAQAVTTSDGVILAVTVSNSSSDTTAFGPTLTAATQMAARIGAGPIGLVLADAGYLSIENLTCPGPDRLIAVGSRRDLERRAAGDDRDLPAESAPEIAAMRDRLATPEGIAAYRQRGQIAETTFGHGKHNLGFRRFSGTGTPRAKAEWTFHAAVHNISKILATKTINDLAPA